MLAIVRVKTNNGCDKLWDYIIENHEELEKKFDDCVELMYITKRAKHDDTSLFIHADSPDCFGNFVAQIISPIPEVDGVWMFNMMNMRFYHLVKDLIKDWQRYVVTVKAYPGKFEDIYNTRSKVTQTSNATPAYIAYTFHLYGDSIMFSLLADSENAAQEFVTKNIKDLPGVLSTNITSIKKQQRLAPRQDWKLYVKTNMLPNL